MSETSPVRPRLIGFALVLATLTGLACSSGDGPFAGMRVTTTPPDLEYLPPERVRTSMWVFAAEARELESLLEPKPTLAQEADRREAVRATLDRMRIALRNLDRPGRSTQHPMLNRHLETFQRRLDRARRAVDRDPPDYFPASTIAGSCSLCHGRHESAGIPRALDGRLTARAGDFPDTPGQGRGVHR